MPENTNQAAHAQEPEKKRKKRFIIIPLVIVLFVGAIAVIYFATSSGGGWFDSGAQQGSYEGKTEEEILADLNRQVEEGMMNISIASTITFEDGTSEGEARIENIESNKRDQKVVITLDDTGEVIYESGAIPPGSFIQKIRLNRDLDAGTYAATAMFTGYDIETHQDKGSAGAQIKIVVLN